MVLVTTVYVYSGNSYPDTSLILELAAWENAQYFNGPDQDHLYHSFFSP